MIVPITSNAPNAQDLIRILEVEFSGQYSYKIFGLGSQPTVIVSKSWFSGAQITIQKDGINLEEVVPSVPLALLSSFFMYFIGFAVPFGSWKEKLSKRLGNFLSQKFN